MKMIKSILLCAVVGFSIAGCATGPGGQAADTPPRLVAQNNTVVWDNPAAFGPVPEELAAAGQAVCGTLDTPEVQHKAIGYHPGAIGADGQPFPNGGYFCAVK